MPAALGLIATARSRSASLIQRTGVAPMPAALGLIATARS